MKRQLARGPVFGDRPNPVLRFKGPVVAKIAVKSSPQPVAVPFGGVPKSNCSEKTCSTEYSTAAGLIGFQAPV